MDSKIGIVEAKFLQNPDPRAPLLWGFVHEVCPGPTAIYPEKINAPNLQGKWPVDIEHTPDTAAIPRGNTPTFIRNPG